MSITAYISNDNVLSVTGLQNAVDSSYLNSATVTVTVVDSDGNEVSGQTWPTSLSYVSSSNGNYRCTLTDSISWIRGQYTAQVTADAGDGLKGYWDISVNVVPRKG